MPIFKLHCIAGANPLTNIKTDYETSEKLGQYKIGKEAIFYPGFPGTWYLPYASATKALTRNASLLLTGCCGKALPMVRFRVYYGDKGAFMDFMFEKPEEANKALDQILLFNPNLEYEREERPLDIF